MPHLNIITSNRLEVLSKALAERVRTSLSSPMEPEIIVVQSRGMERWISLELAKHNGICANCYFPFPNAFLNDIFTLLIPDLPDPSPFDPGILTFCIMALLPSLIQQPGFESLKAYLQDDADGRKQFQLSERIADVFDQYLVFRPQMIFQWEAGKTGHWQAQLWRVLTEENHHHRAWLVKTALKILNQTELPDIPLPQRVSVFGISYLPPSYLEIFAALSRKIDVYFFLMNPCQEYWSEIVTNRELKRIRDKYAVNDAVEPLHLDQGNRLLASMGLLGRDFHHQIYGFDADIDEQFEDMDPHHLLSHVQFDILNLDSRSIPWILPDNRDTSVQFHSCHNPMREVEVLYDQLLAMFEKDPTLKPRDILVLTPDIETYAPYIHAVFDAQINERMRMPYSVADQSVKSKSRTINGFLSLLDLKNSRMTATDVMGLLENPLIRNQFNLSDSDMEILNRWIKETRIRWGIDAGYRHKMGLPDLSNNTWRAGIERLLLGYAFPGDHRELFDGILPYDHIEGDDAIILGKFLDYFEQLCDAVEMLDQPYNTAGWVNFLNHLLYIFFPDEEQTEQDMRIIRQALDTLLRNADAANYDAAVDFIVIRSYLENCFREQNVGYGFITGGITFCAMLPMRSIPVKVICLIGMNNDAFPRKWTPLGFDLISRYPKRGDRSRRNDEKYLFLEAIISARNTFYISYVGQNIQDNSPIPPSSLVSELLDYIMDGFHMAESQLITRHRLQAFSYRYFIENEENLFSYSTENLLAAVSFSQQIAPPPFITKKLPPPPSEWKKITIDDLAEFFCQPTRYFLEKRLGIVIREADRLFADTENFNLDNLEKYMLGQDIVHAIQSGMDEKDHLAIQKADGALPHGRIGDVLYHELRADADAYVNKLNGLIRTESIGIREIDLAISDFQLTGIIEDLYETGQIRSRYGNKTTKDLIRTWIYHLILNQVMETDFPCNTRLICKDVSLEFEPLPNSGYLLENLLNTFWTGLTAPLHFFPESSHAFARNILVRNQDKKIAWDAARRTWTGNDFSRGESEDAYYDICFRRDNPLDAEFEDMAIDFFEPLFNSMRELSL